jgi:hypothetical protein
MRRPVQTSLWPEVVADRPIGPIVGSVQQGSNADLIATIAPLYLTGEVCDLTYGLGRWWDRYRPAGLVCHDLDPDKGDGVDFTALPEPDDSYDAVTFDPPYVPAGGYLTSTRRLDYRDRFGLIQRSQAELVDLWRAGLTEAARVSRRWVLVKCGDYVSGTALVLGHRVMLDLADELGLICWDLIVHWSGSGPGGHNIVDVLRARRQHSYLLVLRHRGPRSGVPHR